MGKILVVSELDGDYSITYQADAPELPFNWADHTEANAKILDGKLIGRDVGGAEWSADIALVEGNSVEFHAAVNPKNAYAGTFLLDKYGYPTRDLQNYSGKLTIAALGDDVVLHGIVHHGVCKITVQLRRK